MSEEQFSAFQSIMEDLGMGEEAVVAAVGGGGGLVGPLTCAHLYEIGTHVDLSEYNKMVGESAAVTPDMMLPRGETWKRLFWYESTEGRKLAEKAYEATGKEFGVNHVFFAAMKRSQAINLTEEALERASSDDAFADCSIATFQSKKYRHEYQLIVLPTLVRSVAECYRVELGIPDEAALEFDVSELRNRDAVFTDDLFTKLCGDPESKNGYLDGVLFQRREKLWAELGEQDATKFKPAGLDRYSVSSPLLSQILSFIRRRWTKPHWGRLTWLNDPRVDAVSDDGEYRDTLPGIIKLYKTEAEAREDVGPIGEGESTSVPGKKIPTAWADMADMFVAEVEAALASVAGKPRKIQVAKVASELDITTEEADPWVPS